AYLVFQASCRARRSSSVQTAWTSSSRVSIGAKSASTAVDAQCARSMGREDEEATCDGEVFHEHDRLCLISEVVVEEDRRGDGEQCHAESNEACLITHKDEQAATDFCGKRDGVA